MTSLEQLQKATDKMSKRADYEVYQAIQQCNEMLRNDGDKRAIKAFYEMAEHFIGKDKMTAGLEKYGFIGLKKVVAK